MKTCTLATMTWIAILAAVALFLATDGARAADPEPAAPAANGAATGAAPAAKEAASAAAATAGAPITGLEAATRMDDARRAKTEHNVMTMTLQNARGQQRVRTIEGWTREITDEEEHRFARFLEPSDVKDTTLLTYDFDEADDDIWLYLPALKKVKRILSSNKTDYFMGSDFTYWDMENIDLLNWDYQLTGSETVDGVDTYVVPATPKNDKEIEESGYDKVVYWIGKTDWIARKIEFTDTKGRLGKRLTLSDVKPTSRQLSSARPFISTVQRLFMLSSCACEPDSMPICTWWQPAAFISSGVARSARSSARA